MPGALIDGASVLSVGGLIDFLSLERREASQILGGSSIVREGKGYVEMTALPPSLCTWFHGLLVWSENGLSVCIEMFGQLLSLEEVKRYCSISL